MESADLGEPQTGGDEEGIAERPDLDSREERIRTTRKPAGPALEEPGDEEGVAGEGDDPPPVDPADE